MDAGEVTIGNKTMPKLKPTPLTIMISDAHMVIERIEGGVQVAVQG